MPLNALLSLTALIRVQTYDQILKMGLAVARVVGLPVTSWAEGDPTRSLYHYLAEVLANLEEANAEAIRSGFLSTARGKWLQILAYEVYGYEFQEATYATPSITLSNTGGGLYEYESEGDFISKSTLTGKTYHNTSTGTLGPGGTLTLQLVADEEGSDSSVSANGIDAIVTTALGVSIVSSTVGVGLDEESDESIKRNCEDSRGSLSPNGPADSYAWVAKNTKLTGVSDVQRVQVIYNDPAGHVTVYIASAGGEVAPASVTAVQAALLLWATPGCMTPTTVAATAVPLDVVLDVTGDELPGDLETPISTALDAYLATIDIAGTAAHFKIESKAGLAVPEIDTLEATTPADNVAYADGTFPVLGALTVNVVG